MKHFTFNILTGFGSLQGDGFEEESYDDEVGKECCEPNYLAGGVEALNVGVNNEYSSDISQGWGNTEHFLGHIFSFLIKPFLGGFMRVYLGIYFQFLSHLPDMRIWDSVRRERKGYLGRPNIKTRPFMMMR